MAWTEHLLNSQHFLEHNIKTHINSLIDQLIVYRQYKFVIFKKKKNLKIKSHKKVRKCGDRMEI